MAAARGDRADSADDCGVDWRRWCGTVQTFASQTRMCHVFTLLRALRRALCTNQ